MQNESGISKKYNPVLYNSRNIRYKSPFGAVSTRRKVTLLFPVADYIKADSVKLFLRRNSHFLEYELRKVGTEEGYDIFTVEFTVEMAGTYNYRFEIYAGEEILYCGKGRGGEAVIGEWLPEWQLSVYQSHYSTAEFIKGGVVYQIFCDRFRASGKAPASKYGVMKSPSEDVTVRDADGVYRANDFYGGDFYGIIEKIEYLKNLGVTAIYLSPVFESSSNHRYDTGDYCKIDEMLGGEEGFLRLIEACNEADIAIILDGVFNHTGADSKYFNKFNRYDSLGAYQSRESEYFDWYTFYEFPDEYKCWWGCTVVPTVSREAKGYQEMIAGEGGVLETRLLQGVKGWRLDVVDELSESFVKKIRERIKKTNPDALVLGEVWEDASTKYSYGEEREYFYGDDLDGVMNYVFKDAINAYVTGGSAEEFVETVMTITENYPKESLDTCFTLIDSHDTVRAINAYSGADVSNMSKEEKKYYRLSESEYELGKARLKIASCLQYFLPGVPSLYYGDEAGIQGFEDPLNRRYYPWENPDEELLEHYTKLGALRKEYRKDFTERAEIYAEDGKVRIIRGRLSLTVDPINIGYEIKIS